MTPVQISPKIRTRLPVTKAHVKRQYWIMVLPKDPAFLGSHPGILLIISCVFLDKFLNLSVSDAPSMKGDYIYLVELSGGLNALKMHKALRIVPGI